MTVPNFAKGLTFYSGMVSFGNATQTYSFKFDGLIPDSNDRAIFHLQTMTVNGNEVVANRPACFSFNLFFDNGCGDLVVSSSAIHRLAALGRAVCDLFTSCGWPKCHPFGSCSANHNGSLPDV